MGRPGKHGAALARQALLQFRLQAGREPALRDVSREEELGRREALQVAAIGTGVDQLGVARFVPGGMVRRDDGHDLPAACRQGPDPIGRLAEGLVKHPRLAGRQARRHDRGHRQHEHAQR